MKIIKLLILILIVYLIWTRWDYIVSFGRGLSSFYGHVMNKAYTTIVDGDTCKADSITQVN